MLIRCYKDSCLSIRILIKSLIHQNTGTLDYLAEGNDQLTAFKKGTDVFAPKQRENNVRFIIMNYFREQAAQGLCVESKVEGRIVIK